MSAGLLSLVDPVVGHGCAAAVAAILLMGAWQKLADNGVFRATVELYGLLPAGLVGLFAAAYPVAEVLAAGALLGWADSPALLLPLGVLSVATLGVAINVLRGRTDLECGCGGDSHPRLSWALVARNGLLLGAVLLAGAAEDARALVWIDYLSVAALTLALLGLYAAANQLLANQPHLIQSGSHS
ncbi:MauE/DoxX family redox-associated membrane protein [Zoogloea sp. LCSB751]|uniref:MauE/DoxX family redox-associated membrane protein n=1 Tax=Zoogloea sp. LCSB751 TaxID=1965277 RepID=UPI0009A49DBC|nr:MauE/DoxX family redox-associated membrane protein [Zoogloea sp. LCSB751]